MGGDYGGGRCGCDGDSDEPTMMMEMVGVVAVMAVAAKAIWTVIVVEAFMMV